MRSIELAHGLDKHESNVLRSFPKIRKVATGTAPPGLGMSLVLRQPLPQLQEEHHSVARDHTAGNPPLCAIGKEQRANELNQHERDQEIGNARTRSWHDGPAGLQMAGLLPFFVSPPRRILDHPETNPDEAAGQQSDE